jgi:hypothetical protein
MTVADHTAPGVQRRHVRSGKGTARLPRYVVKERVGCRRGTVPVAIGAGPLRPATEKLFGVFSEVAQLALLAHVGNGVGRELDLVGVRAVRIRLHPPGHVVCQTIRQLTAATSAEHRGSDRLAARVDLERLGGARYIVDGGGYNRAGSRPSSTSRNKFPAASFSKLATPRPPRAGTIHRTHQPGSRHANGTLTAASPRSCAACPR